MVNLSGQLRMSDCMIMSTTDVQQKKKKQSKRGHIDVGLYKVQICIGSDNVS